MKEHERLRKKLEELSAQNTEKNKELIQETVETYIQACTVDETVKSYDLKKLSFPDISFAGVEFLKPAYFNEVCFKGYGNFSESTFHEYVTFNKATFTGYANFSDAIFGKDANFLNVKYLENAGFWMTQFLGNTDFSKSNFVGWLDLRSAVFMGYAWFTHSSFGKRTDFKGCIFHDEIDLSNSTFAFLKNIPSDAGKYGEKSVYLENAVLKAAHFWSLDSLSHYNFKGAFLLSVSLADKTLLDCNFTGAMMKQIFTDGWHLDKATIKNTKYIFTDYQVEEQLNEAGIKKNVYMPVKESRVPADGFFGEGQQ